MGSEVQEKRRDRPVSGFVTLVSGIALGMGVLFGLTAGVGAVWTSVTASSPTTKAASGGGSASVVDLVIKDVSTPAGSQPAYVGPNGVGAADLFTVKAGQSVEVVVKNEDAMPHTFDVPTLDLNVSIGADSTTTFHFLANSAGSYTFQCIVPCGSWVMAHMGYMEGNVKVVA